MAGTNVFRKLLIPLGGQKKVPFGRKEKSLQESNTPQENVTQAISSSSTSNCGKRVSARASVVTRPGKPTSSESPVASALIC